MNIYFNKPFATGKELAYIQQAISNAHLSGNGEFTQKCHAWLESEIGCLKAFLTHSCTGALEMAAILADIQPGDEVIMPSYTFVSTANAFILRGGVPVFVDIRPDTLNIDETLIEAAITPKTKAIIPVHYAGVGCELDTIMKIAQRHRLLVIEDAAQGIASTYKGKPLGSIGHLATLSFHETKNVNCGQGGALLVNYRQLCDRADIVWQKGTNRTQFCQGFADKYTWVDMGSSYLHSELNAAYLWAQLESATAITQNRLNIWQRYHQGFADLEAEGKVRRPIVPPECQHNAHMYYLLLPNLKSRTTLIDKLDACGINAVFHYVPLHSSPAGRKYGKTQGDLFLTQELSDRLVRLPLWVGMDEYVDYAIEKVITIVRQL